MLQQFEKQQLPPKRVSLVRNQYGEKIMKIIFPYDVYMIGQIRTLVGRSFHSELKCWTAPIYSDSVTALQKWGFVLSPAILSHLTRKTESKLSVSGIPGLKLQPFPYQYSGVEFIERCSGNALLADEMGLGKTIQALAWLQLHRDKIPVLIVVPASLKLNWEREAEKWLPEPKVEILSGTKPWKTKGNILVINYDVLPAWLDELKKLNIQVLITDECHYYKSNKAKRTKAVKQLGKEIPHIIALSGTPIVNRPIEIYNAVHLIKPELFPNQMDFARTYCGARLTQYGWDFNGSTNTKQLHSILTDTIMIRRLKKDVLKDLPDKIYSFIPMELSDDSEYNSAKNNFIDYIAEKKGRHAALKASLAEILVQMETLKQLAVKGILDEAINWIKDFLESGNKLVIFATHKFVIETIMNAFGNKIAVKIDGTVNMQDRQRSIDIFQLNPNVKIFIANIQAGGVGITLTAASNVLFLELPWTPGALRQAIARLDRIGQKFAVNVYYLFAINTIMQSFAKLIDAKQKILDAVLDGKDTDTSDLVYELMKEFER
jgi:SWI/SNF-related matrix-associated actin-dependent regulator 1 of chromatin subfamily A